MPQNQQEIRANAPNYEIYIFHPSSSGAQPWERKHTTQNPRMAMRRAAILHESRAYRRVEVRKKYFDVRKDRHIDARVKVYGDQPEKLRRRLLRFFKLYLGALAFYGLASLAAQIGF